MAFLYSYRFHKNFDQESIPQNADAIAMVDVKNIRNYFIFSYLKNPSEWNPKAFSDFKKRFDLSNFGLKTPDYLAFSHIENQPITQWFVTIKIENETAFEQAITKAHFQKTKLQNGLRFYYSSSAAFCIVKHSNRILISNISVKQKQIALNIADDMFVKKLFLDTKKTEKTIGTSNAMTLWIKKNDLLTEDEIININLKEQEITAEGKLKLNYKKEIQFSQNPDALLSLGFDFAMLRKLNILKRHSTKINKMIGFDLDSILSCNPTKTELILNGIVEKKDSAISYDYDDDFNPIKKVVWNTHREPSFYFSMQTANSQKAYNYLKSQNAIDNHQLFVNFPLAQTKTSIHNNAVILEANAIKNRNSPTSVPKIGYLRIQFKKLHPTDWLFLIAKNKIFSILQPFETLEADLSKENNAAFFQARLKTKDNQKLISVLK
jgi:hypothetical protein